MFILGLSFLNQSPHGKFVKNREILQIRCCSGSTARLKTIINEYQPFTDTLQTRKFAYLSIKAPVCQ